MPESRLFHSLSLWLKRDLRLSAEVTFFAGKQAEALLLWRKVVREKTNLNSSKARNSQQLTVALTAPSLCNCVAAFKERNMDKHYRAWFAAAVLMFQNSHSLLGTSLSNCFSAWKNALTFLTKQLCPRTLPPPFPAQCRAKHCILEWQVPSSSSCFSREANTSHRRVAASWQGPWLGKQNILIFCWNNPLCCRQFWHVLGVTRIATRHDLYLTTQSTNPVSMPAMITSAVFMWLHPFYATVFICVLSLLCVFSLSPFAFCIFRP